MFDRPLSYLSDDVLSGAMTLALRIARRKGSGFRYAGLDYWDGPPQARAVLVVIEEYKCRHARSHT